jgi:hypothetical protein
VIGESGSWWGEISVWRRYLPFDDSNARLTLISHGHGKSCEGVLIRTRAIYRGDENVELAQVYR